MKPECETRGKLLQTALELIWESSYGSVSVDDICKRAGVRKGSFYYFFPSKSDLAVAAFELHWQENKPRWDRAFSPSLPPLERFSLYAQLVYEKQLEKKKTCGKVCGCPYASVGSELSTQDENIRKESLRIVERCVRYFESALTDALRENQIPPCDPATKARELYAYVSGALLQAKIYNDPEIMKDLAASLFRLMEVDEKLASVIRE